MLKKLTITLCALLALTGCSDSGEHTLDAYTLTVNLSDSLKSDSAWLLIVDADYALVRQADAEPRKDNSFVFRGQIDREALAYIRLGSDSTHYDFPFALSANDITIDIHSGSWKITGGRSNNIYQRFLNAYRHMSLRRNNLWADYKRLAADSTLTPEAERTLAERDSLLADSMQRYLRWRVAGNDIASQLVNIRLGHQLDSLHRSRSER